MKVGKELVLVGQTVCSDSLSHIRQSGFVSISGSSPSPLISSALFSKSEIAPMPSGWIIQLMGLGVCFLFLS